ncbi:MAG TPA: hypothetical protein PKC09_02285 [Paracoccus sp. (in: a-proteobacteria)]|uniref:hypothetical protein n=1 Tax=uncultured Paracoccus sp. TaxID=189685 RepID=UPI0026103023|nr:hypothetical protein [uncultured Paracoccus sp.]HMQ40079.1 hypothetical protein [Paracoccus sp. (in: a-proteobacteria)]HMR35327.1 hypothetical protein [Paracoccus sp. (in: a-proteobacteria)]
MFKKMALVVAAVATLSACAITPKDYETTPVIAQSPLGPVICQIYTHEQVTWDRSIRRPEKMDTETADNLCRQEGQRILDGGEPNYVPTVDTTSAEVVDISTTNGGL